MYPTCVNCRRHFTITAKHSLSRNAAKRIPKINSSCLCSSAIGLPLCVFSLVFWPICLASRISANVVSRNFVKKINTLKAPFKQRENIEMYLKACTNYGLKEQDLFQVNDLYENKNLYMVVDNLYALGGLAQRKNFNGPVLGKKMATENKRNFDDDVLKAGQSMIGLQYGTNKGASQAGMTPYGASRQIRPEDFIKNGEPDRT